MNITKEEMLNALTDSDANNAWAGLTKEYCAIRALIESSGEKEPKMEILKREDGWWLSIASPSGKQALFNLGPTHHPRKICTEVLEEALSYQPGPDIKPEGNNAPLSGPRAISNKEVEELENWEPDMEGIGGWTRNPAPSPAPSVERREGHCALKYDKTTRTIKTFGPNPAPLPKEAEAAIIRIEDCIEDAFAHRQNHTDKSYPIDEVQKDSVKDFDALAVIRVAIRPKIVTRRWVETLAFSVANEHQDDCDELIREWLRDLGIEVGP